MLSLFKMILENVLFFALHIDSTNSFPGQLSKKEELECIKKAAQGDSKARDKLINHNLRLVAFIVKKNYPDTNEDPEDLISIGTIGLIKAAQTFDYERNVNFSTYAGKCINNQIRMYFRKIKHKNTEVHIDDPIDSDKDGNTVSLADIFCDDTNVEDEAALSIERKRLYRFIEEELDEREKEIISKRYGIRCGKYIPERIMTQREVATCLDISRRYVSRIEKKALQKLRARFDEGGVI